jgi:hypothetical protein
MYFSHRKNGTVAKRDCRADVLQQRQTLTLGAKPHSSDTGGHKGQPPMSFFVEVLWRDSKKQVSEYTYNVNYM